MLSMCPRCLSHTTSLLHVHFVSSFIAVRSFLPPSAIIKIIWDLRMASLHKKQEDLKKSCSDSGYTSPIPQGPDYTVLVEGNIGVGKSTFLNMLRSDTTLESVKLYPEPVHLWKNINGHNALELMYKDPKRWSMTFQTYVMKTMLDIHIQKQSEQVKMMERSIFSGHHCFVRNLYNTGMITDMEHSVLKSWYNWIIEHEPVSVDLIVYLRSSPETCLDRIKKRDRTEEIGISLDYLKQLHTLHEDWLMKSECPAGFTNAKLLVLDADQDLDEFRLEVDKVRSTISKPTGHSVAPLRTTAVSA